MTQELVTRPAYSFPLQTILGLEKCDADALRRCLEENEGQYRMVGRWELTGLAIQLVWSLATLAANT